MAKNESKFDNDGRWSVDSARGRKKNASEMENERTVEDVAAVFETMFPEIDTVEKIKNCGIENEETLSFYGSLREMIKKDKRLLKVDDNELAEKMRKLMESKVNSTFNKEKRAQINSIFSGEDVFDEEIVQEKKPLAEAGRKMVEEKIRIIQEAWEQGVLDVDVEKYLLRAEDFSATGGYADEELKEFVESENELLREMHKGCVDYPKKKETEEESFSIRSEKDGEKQQDKEGVDEEISTAEYIEQLRKFSGNSGSLSSGEAGTAVKIELAETREAEAEVVPVEENQAEKNNPAQNDAKIIENEEISQKKERKTGDTRTFKERLEFSTNKQIEIFSKIENGEIDSSRFKDLSAYFAEIDTYYEKEQIGLGGMTEVNRKHAQSLYEKAKAEIELKWREVFTLLIERFKKYVDEEVERKMKILKNDKDSGKLASTVDAYIFLLSDINRDQTRHLMPDSNEVKEEMKKCLANGRKEIKKAYRLALKEIDRKKKDSLAEETEVNENESAEDDKESQEFEFPEKIVNIFKGAAMKAYEFYLKELDGSDGYLADFSNEDKREFLRLLLKKMLKDKYGEKRTILKEKFGFSSSDEDVFINKILDLVL